jgi:ATP-dependent Lhr-like helicase
MVRRRGPPPAPATLEPVEPVALARFLAAWQGVTSPRRGIEALVDAITQLQGAAIPASALESDVLAARVDAYRPADLDELCASGEVVWIGAGGLGATDGRVALVFRDQARLLAPPNPAEPPSGPLVDALRAHLATAGASFWPDLLRAAGAADDRAVLAALWDLVWAGEVTNDGITPLRALLAGRPRAPRGKPRPGRITRLGPPAGAGRWSLVSTLLQPPPNATELAAGRARQLLDRYGVVTREAVRAEGVPGGYAAVYPALRAMEDGGRARRGYFVAGLGAAQFALPGAAERLRAQRDVERGDPGADADLDDHTGRSLVLAATDPAQPYGAALPWPEPATPGGGGRPARAAGAYVALAAGEPLAYLDRGSRSVITFPAGADPEGWIEAFSTLVKDGRLRRLELHRIDGGPVRESPAATALAAAGFVPTLKGLALHG